MSLRTLSALQWTGILVAPLAWTAQHVMGFGVGDARCSAAGPRWGVDVAVWELALLACAGLLVVAAEAAAVAVFLRTRGSGFGDGPPAEEQGLRETRLHFFATAALVANVLFLSIMLYDGIGSALETVCRQS
jgi:hypothetical protein